jgi:hypothetical protein
MLFIYNMSDYLTRFDNNLHIFLGGVKVEVRKVVERIYSKKMSCGNFLGTSGKVALATTIGLTTSNSLANKDVEALFTFNEYPFTPGVASVTRWRRIMDKISS